MKEISIQDLKAALSAAIAEAEAGESIIITRHKEPVAQLIPAHPQYVSRGKEAGKRNIRPAIKRGKKIPYLDVLRDDRSDR